MRSGLLCNPSRNLAAHFLKGHYLLRFQREDAFIERGQHAGIFQKSPIEPFDEPKALLYGEFFDSGLDFGGGAQTKNDIEPIPPGKPSLVFAIRFESGA